MTSHFIYGPYTFEASAMDRSDGSNLAPAYRPPPLPASRGCPRLTSQSVDRLRLLVGGKRRDQVGDGGAAGRMPPVRIDVCQRQQDESAFMQPWMWQDRTFRAIHDAVVICDQVEIQNSRLITDFAGSPEFRFNIMKQTE